MSSINTSLPEGRAPRMSHMMSANEGPMDIIAKVSGHVSGGKREDDAPYFTNNEGHPIPDPAHSKTVGGIPMMSDVHLMQKQQTFNRSKNLERMVHPCGSGAFGYFETTADVSDMTKADFLQRPGEKTPAFVRFSTVTLGREFPDEARNPRGFAIKLYTGEGNYDIVGLVSYSTFRHICIETDLCFRTSRSSSVVILSKDRMSSARRLATPRTSCSTTMRLSIYWATPLRVTTLV